MRLLRRASVGQVGSQSEHRHVAARELGPQRRTLGGAASAGVHANIVSQLNVKIIVDQTLHARLRRWCRRSVAPYTRPIILDENADPPRPYAEHAYHRELRAVPDRPACRAGCSNMDARAGGATEAGDAGADLDDSSPSMGHARPETTVRYIRGKKLETTRRVASARLAHRAKQTGNRVPDEL